MEKIGFEIITKEKVHFNLTLAEQRQFPTHNFQLYEHQKKLLVLEYSPLAKLNESKAEFIELAIKTIKRDFKALSVKVMEIETQKDIKRKKKTEEVKKIENNTNSKL